MLARIGARAPGARRGCHALVRHTAGLRNGREFFTLLAHILCANRIAHGNRIALHIHGRCSAPRVPVTTTSLSSLLAGAGDAAERGPPALLEYENFSPASAVRGRDLRRRRRLTSGCAESSWSPCPFSRNRPERTRALSASAAAFESAGVAAAGAESLSGQPAVRLPLASRRRARAPRLRDDAATYSRPPPFRPGRCRHWPHHPSALVAYTRASNLSRVCAGKTQSA